MPKIKVLVKKPCEEAEVQEIENTLESFQKIIGGYIQVVNHQRGVAIVCDEEGKLKGLKANILFGNDIIVGTIIICSFDDNGDFTSLSDKEIIFNKISCKNCDIWEENNA